MAKSDDEQLPPEPSKAQLNQAEKDEEARRANPNEPVARKANPKFGGESFAYGVNPDEDTSEKKGGQSFVYGQPS